MSICGIAASISSFKDDIIAKISGFLDLKETLGTLPGIDTLKSLLPAGLASLKDKLQGMLPDIPISTSAFSSLRSDLGSIVGSASAFASGLSGFVSKYSGITSLRGMANINLSDLANSAFSLGGSFDPLHIGHLAIAESSLNNCDFFLFIPAKQSPHKSSLPVVSDLHRIKMLELIVSNLSNTNKFSFNMIFSLFP